MRLPAASDDGKRNCLDRTERHVRQRTAESRARPKHAVPGALTISLPGHAVVGPVSANRLQLAQDPNPRGQPPGTATAKSTGATQSQVLGPRFAGCQTPRSPSMSRSMLASTSSST